jgi:hypothetical protein
MRISLAAALLFLATPAFGEMLRFDVAFNDTLITANSDRLVTGDRVVMNDRLLTDGEDAGAVHGVCTITDPNGFAICSVTFVIGDDSLSTQFVNSPPPEKHFTILGGTGEYAGATGTGVLIEHGDETGTVSFTID